MINKTNLSKYIKTIEKSKKRAVYPKDLSLELGIKEEVIKENLIEFDPTINFIDVNLKDLLPKMKDRLIELEAKKSKKQNREVRNNEANEYSDVLDFIYRNMCDSGGLLNLSYTIKSKDIKILNKLLKKEKENLNK